MTSQMHIEIRQVYNLFQEPVEQLPGGLSIAEEKNQTVFKTKQVKKLAANLFTHLCMHFSIVINVYCLYT